MSVGQIAKGVGYFAIGTSLSVMFASAVVRGFIVFHPAIEDNKLFWWLKGVATDSGVVLSSVRDTLVVIPNGVACAVGKRPFFLDEVGIVADHDGDVGRGNCVVGVALEWGYDMKRNIVDAYFSKDSQEPSNG